jgi:hypothetical protein
VGVTIDTISIEIESSSFGAAKGIDALAKSLEGLKKNGSFKTVSTKEDCLNFALKYKFLFSKIKNVRTSLF